MQTEPCPTLLLSQLKELPQYSIGEAITKLFFILKLTKILTKNAILSKLLFRRSLLACFDFIKFFKMIKETHRSSGC